MNLKHKREKILKKLANKDYRDAWVDEGVKMIVPYQIQAIRNQKGWSQTILGKKAGMLPNAVSRLESIDYGNLSVNTLLRIAHGFDCGLLVKFVPFSRLVKEFEDKSPDGLEVESFDDDSINLEGWQNEADEINENPTSQASKDVIKTLLASLNAEDGATIRVSPPNNSFISFSINTSTKDGSFFQSSYTEPSEANSLALCEVY